MLTIKNLTVTFGGVVALCLHRFEVGDRELRVVIGPNGAGKSTLMDVICGKTRPNEGSVMFDGQELMGRSEIDITELGVGRKFQKPSVFESLTVYDNLLLGLQGDKGVLRSMFFHLDALHREKIVQTAERVGLSDHLGELAGSLSHGQKQWLEIAIVLVQNPKLLLIDEPAAGMSDSEAAKTADLLLDLASDHSVVVIEHDMHFVQRIARQSVTVLVRGSILTEGPFEEVKANKKVIDCYLGSPDSAQSAGPKRRQA